MWRPPHGLWLKFSLQLAVVSVVLSAAAGRIYECMHLCTKRVRVQDRGHGRHSHLTPGGSLVQGTQTAAAGCAGWCPHRSVQVGREGQWGICVHCTLCKDRGRDRGVQARIVLGEGQIQQLCTHPHVQTCALIRARTCMHARTHACMHTHTLAHYSWPFPPHTAAGARHA